MFSMHQMHTQSAAIKPATTSPSPIPSNLSGAALSVACAAADELDADEDAEELLLAPAAVAVDAHVAWLGIAVTPLLEQRVLA